MNKIITIIKETIIGKSKVTSADHYNPDCTNYNQETSTQPPPVQVVDVKRVYVAHPISGDVFGNTEKVREICMGLVDEIIDNTQILPIAPYLGLLEYLDEDNEIHRFIGMEHGLDVLSMCDELWVYGFSKGVHQEINHAIDFGIPVVVKRGLGEFGDEQYDKIDA